MPQFGDTFGELFGDAIAPNENHDAEAEARVVYALRNATNYKKIIAIFVAKIQELENIMAGITPEMLFDIPTAYGKNLDQIGSILRLPREGWDDPLYRIYLRTQALLILPGRRGQANLMKVVRSLMDTDAGSIGYTESIPKTYTLTVPTATLDQLAGWVRFLERCRPATYIPVLGWIPPNPFGYDDLTAVETYTLNPYADASFALVVDTQYAGLVPI